MTWTCALELDEQREIRTGSAAALAEAVRKGADLRIYTEFLHNEHIDVSSSNGERVLEVSEFAVTYLLEERWSAGIMSLRQPIELPDGFGPRPSMSFFLYNQDGQQAIARPYLDGRPADGSPGASPPTSPAEMRKYHTQSSWDAKTNAPSSNFVYEFGAYRFCVWDGWREVFAHDRQGKVRSGSIDALIGAFANGSEIKVGIRGLCAGLGEAPTVEHEVFVRAGPGYYYTDQRVFIAGTHPVVRVKAGIPLVYESKGWDFGWLMVRSDGLVVYRRCDPYTLEFRDREFRHDVRWFVR